MKYRIDIGTDDLELFRALDESHRAGRLISIRVGDYAIEDAFVNHTSLDIEGGGYWPPMRAAISVGVEN